MKTRMLAAIGAAAAITLGAGSVSANPYAISYTGTVGTSGASEINANQTFDVTFVFDNGGSTAASQTWTSGNLQCTIWRFNTARNVVYTQDLASNPVTLASDSATTDASGVLQTNFSLIYDTGAPAFVTYTGVAATSYTFVANGINNIFQRGGSGNVADASGGVQMAPANWSNPTPFSGNCAGRQIGVQAPTISSLSPASGSTLGGTSVVITGANFTNASAVTFGGTPATGFTVISATQITATAPARAAGVVNVVVTTAGGASANTVADDFTYVVPAPVPTLSEWAMILFGAVLAGGAALYIQRRRQVA